jgi:hypothetical protein
MPRAINTTLVAHTANAIATMAIFLFQMAMLKVINISDQLCKHGCGLGQ